MGGNFPAATSEYREKKNEAREEHYRAQMNGLQTMRGAEQRQRANVTVVMPPPKMTFDVIKANIKTLLNSMNGQKNKRERYRGIDGIDRRMVNSLKSALHEHGHGHG